MTAEGVSLYKRYKSWFGIVAGLMAAAILAALVLPRSYALTAISDITQCLLLISGTAAFVMQIVRSRRRVRLFWSLITLGTMLWCAYQLFWTYYEVLLRTDVPDLCSWDIVLFLHIVPFMAAISLRPHVPRDEYSARVGRLDFALLLVWWFYLYVLLVIPWHYVVPDIPAYNRDLNTVYFAEKLVLLLGLATSWATSRSDWKRVYAALFGMTLCYSGASTLANWAIAAKTYYSGSLFDIPLITAMTSLTWIGLTAKTETSNENAPQTSTSYGVWVARSSMIAVFSLPLFAAWTLSDHSVPEKIRIFRLSLTLLAAFCMGIMIAVRQRMLDRELFRLLSRSRESFDSLKRLQAQIVQSEKLASIGQLVGGAAHELNNPITAMLGYSELLLSTPLNEEQKTIAAKIGQYVRRTKLLVASLISFARQTPSLKTSLDLNTLARTSIQLSSPNWKALDVEVRMQFDSGLPKILGDSNQLLHVCVQLITNSLHILGERGGKVLTVSTGQNAGLCRLQVISEVTPDSDGVVATLSPLDAEDSLGLSACRGILKEHRGQISRETRENGSLALCMEIPAAPSGTNPDKPAMVSALWQSQPFA